MATTVTNVYLHVVEDVINNVRTDFQSEGVDDNVLIELQALWELKMMQSGAIQGGAVHEAPAPANPAPKPLSQAPATPVHDLNVPYEATEEYEAPSTDMAFPQVPAMTGSREPVMFQYMPPGPSEESLLPSAGLHLEPKLGSGRPSPYMQQPALWMNQKYRGVELNMNESSVVVKGSGRHRNGVTGKNRRSLQVYEEREDRENGLMQLPIPTQGLPPITKDFLTMSTGKRKHEEIAAGYYIPQRDGAADVELCTSANETCDNMGAEAVGRSWATERVCGRSEDTRLWLQQRLDADAAIERLMNARDLLGLSAIPQVDGIDDNYDDAVAEEDYNDPGEDEPQSVNDAVAKPVKKAERAESEGSEPPLCEDDDDDDVDDTEQGDEEPKTNHLVLAQFDKVTRSKNKWKCTLKDGIMHLNNRDILFVKANGEFEF